MRMNKLKKGDYIKCKDADEAADVADSLNMKGIEWDFVYQKDGQKGIWIEILKGESNE
jgi:hypothetical protein